MTEVELFLSLSHWFGMDSALFLVGSEHFFQSVDVILAGLLSGMVQNLAYCILKIPTFKKP